MRKDNGNFDNYGKYGTGCGAAGKRGTHTPFRQVFEKILFPSRSGLRVADGRVAGIDVGARAVAAMGTLLPLMAAAGTWAGGFVAAHSAHATPTHSATHAAAAHAAPHSSTHTAAHASAESPHAAAHAAKPVMAAHAVARMAVRIGAVIAACRQKGGAGDQQAAQQGPGMGHGQVRKAMNRSVDDVAPGRGGKETVCNRI
ncbi:hypothetical protein GDI0622 [Gluconacetobacter diazotrophicus PA1 5]|uniref:Uncharacterized protein n=1 Tax=Gluconacetobacter diazotrophicus (strain ATCC 49037 / DSM 5601 / CCUG 37298 / CIP 103539 / LMG 7603 / PAl5) TaxID=272568 RepID=A9H8R0_GLUDA|nr:hypothetical protein GDI0622 [Gluconacetobacter diazotrophicus PA1 5]